jgi:hypothetical protein
MEQKRLSTEELAGRGSSRGRERSGEPAGDGGEGEMATELVGRAKTGNGSKLKEMEPDAERRQPLLGGARARALQ